MSKMVKLRTKHTTVLSDNGSFNINQAIIENIKTPIENPIIRFGHV